MVKTLCYRKASIMSWLSRKNNTLQKAYICPPESAKGLWYDPFINRFEDDTGAIMHDLSPYFPLWQLDAWKKTKDYGLLVDRKGDLWELFYNRTNQYRHCQHFCSKCELRCEIYDMFRDW